MAASERLFRKVALERLSSPDRLDALSGIRRPKQWMLWAGIGVLALSTAAWTWFGSVTQRVSGRCIIISPSGISDITANAAGRIIDITVRVGDVVKAGERIGQVVRPELYEQIEGTRGRLGDLRKRQDEIGRYRLASE